MTLQEILDAVSLRYPHALTNAQVISFINDIQKRLFRTMYKVNTATSYDIVEDNAFYPIDFSPENIISVVVDEEEYPYQSIKYDAQDRYFYVTDDNSIGIYPTPEEAIEAGLTVFHYKEPTVLSASNLSAVPEFDADWHEILVYRVCRQLAEIAQDGNMVNNFTTNINTLENEYKRSKRARPHQIKDVYQVGWSV